LSLFYDCHQVLQVKRGQQIKVAEELSHQSRLLTLTMAELSYIHRYAAGGLLALALTQAQMQQYSLPSGLGVTLDIDPDDAHFTSSFTLENEIPWTSMERFLLRHVFRSLLFHWFLF
jgi:hypothetical protein